MYTNDCALTSLVDLQVAWKSIRFQVQLNICEITGELRRFLIHSADPVFAAPTVLSRWFIIGRDRTTVASAAIGCS